jgi:hypothetical protein
VVGRRQVLQPVGSETMLSAVPGHETDIEPASTTSIAVSAAAARLQCGGSRASMTAEADAQTPWALSSATQAGCASHAASRGVIPSCVGVPLPPAAPNRPHPAEPAPWPPPPPPPPPPRPRQRIVAWGLLPCLAARPPAHNQQQLWYRICSKNVVL